MMGTYLYPKARTLAGGASSPSAIFVAMLVLLLSSCEHVHSISLNAHPVTGVGITVQMRPPARVQVVRGERG